MNNPKPTTCPQCRASMRRWALEFRDPKTSKEARTACLRIAKSYRNGWLACRTGEIHAENARRSRPARQILD